MKNKVLVIFTGGTIAMKVDEESGGAIPELGSSELMTMVGEISKYTDVETLDFCNIPSPHMTPNIMFDLSKVINENIKREDISGIVITHGTDTLEETAYFLDLTTNSEKPIVITGAMRNNSELGYDGALNIASAIFTAIDERSKKRGVLAVMNNEIHLAKEVTKTNTNSVDTFKSLEFGPIGIVDEDEAKYHRAESQREYMSIDKLDKKVALIKAVAGIEGDIIDFYIDKKYDGIVIEALGRGNLPPSILPGVKKLIELKIPLILVSRTPTGRVSYTYSYEGGGQDLKNIGVIFGRNLSGPKARIKLLITLEKTKDIEKIKNIFQED